MSTLFQDLKFGVRMLWKTPVISSVAALSLALGIAATLASYLPARSAATVQPTQALSLE